MKLDKVIGQKRGNKQNQLMGETQRKIKIQSGDLGEGQNRQAHMNVVSNVVIKKLADPYHRTKISVNC